MIVSASSDSTCKIWNFSTGNLLSTFGVVDSGAVNTVAWSPVGNKIVTGNAKSDVVLWSIPTTLGINNLYKGNDFEFTLFPNPASDQISINLNKNLKVQKVEILDINGKVVYSFNQLENIIPVNNFQAGIYYLSIQTSENKKAIQSFIKN